MKKTPLIPVAVLLITVAAAGLISDSNVEEVEVADIPKLSSVPVYEEVYERPAGGWEFYLLTYDPRTGDADPSGVDPKSIQVMMNGVDITEEVEIKAVKEDPAYRLSINRYWAPGEYNITLEVADYAGNRAIYKTILIFT